MVTKGQQKWLYEYQTKQTLNQNLLQETKEDIMTNQKHLTTINFYAPNLRGPKYMKQMERSDRKIATQLIGDFNAPLSKMDKMVRQKINKKI